MKVIMEDPEATAREAFFAAIDANIARQVMALRDASGLNQTQFAELGGVRQQTISSLEDAKSNTQTLLTLKKIAFGLGKDLIVEFREKS
jgi:transcriptional regulator with XRE-family HTH domain